MHRPHRRLPLKQQGCPTQSPVSVAHHEAQFAYCPQELCLLCVASTAPGVAQGSWSCMRWVGDAPFVRNSTTAPGANKQIVPHDEPHHEATPLLQHIATERCLGLIFKTRDLVHSKLQLHALRVWTTVTQWPSILLSDRVQFPAPPYL